MKFSKLIFVISLVVVATFGVALVPNAMAGCGVCEKGQKKSKHHHKHSHHPSGPQHVREAICVIYPTAGHTVSGVVRFKQQGHQVKIVADIEGLLPSGIHAIHIHQFGDCSSPDGTSAGGHYNPQGHDHALPPTKQRHAGDLGNLTADSQGKSHYEIEVDNICIVGQKNPVLGRAIIIHAQADDGGQPTGNAGGRIGYGVIGIANAPVNNQPTATAPTTQPRGKSGYR